MQLVAPDILADTCGLSVGLIFAGLFIGVAMWLFGWWCHRFWIVLITTVLAGVYGLYDGAVFRSYPLIAALLLALVGGLLAMALIRLLAFIAGGMVGVLVAQALLPGIDQPLCFLFAGLASLFLIRLAMMTITSLAGTLVISYSALSLLNHYGAMDAVTWAGQGSILLNWICGLLTLLGFGIQWLVDRRRARSQGDDDKCKDSGSWDILLGGGVKWGFGKKAMRKAG